MSVKHYILSLRPMIPYFFGGEKNFAYGIFGQQASKEPYYIESERLPSQSTLFGLTRYLGIENKKEDFSIDPSIIGEESFSLEKEKQKFGKIHNISGLCLEQTTQSGEQVYYVKTPYDHNLNEKNKYIPMSYSVKVKTTLGEMLVPMEYNAKNGVADSYMSLTDGSLIDSDDIFLSDLQVKIAKGKDNDGFLKKKYWTLKSGFQFAFSVCVEDGFPEIKKQIVFLGKEKSPFLLSVKTGKIPVNEELFCSDICFQNKSGKTESFIRKVALSDWYLRDESDLSSYCIMSYVKEKTHREFMTNYNKDKNVSHLRRYKKHKQMLRLIAAGSVFIVKKEYKDSFDKMIQNSHAQKAGYNWMNGGK